ncbi:MAG: hypothetical protein DME66_00545 [Verrucomicrobia bacterium]|nr:MAG: hypothetical protein DME66_00545 [Verrucomicrobiota bacterium]
MTLRLQSNGRRLVTNTSPARWSLRRFTTLLRFYQGVVKYQLMRADCVSERVDPFGSDVAENRNWAI